MGRRLRPSRVPGVDGIGFHATVPDVDDPDDQREQLGRALRRRETLRAIVAAQRRHLEVAEAITTAADRASTATAVAVLLGATHDDALAVVDIPWRNLCGQRREQAREDLDHVDHDVSERLAQSRGSGGAP